MALPMAMMTLVLLTTLMLAFSVLSQSEPVIASNQLRTSQARALAESGVEHAIWALSAGNVPPGEVVPDGALPNPLPNPAPAPFDLSVFTAIGNIGGYRVRVTDPTPLSETEHVREILSVGWTPTDAVITNSHRRIGVTVQALRNPALNALGALMVRGKLQVSGTSLISAHNADNPACSAKYGAYTADSLARAGASKIYGPAGTAPGNLEGVDYVQNQGDEAFDGLAFTNRELNMLRDLAKKNGTYFGPGFSGFTTSSGTAQTGTWDGNVSFSSSNKLKSGVVFIDTDTGQNITPSTPLSEFASASISGNPFIDPTFTGMLVVNGSLQISGNMKIHGLVYVMDNLTYNGTGSGEIAGMVIAQNIRDTSETAISESDATETGNSRIRSECLPPYATPRVFALVPGTYRELPD